MTFTPQDFDEATELAGLLQKMDHIDFAYAEKIGDEIFRQQPFFLSVLLGYHMDTTPQELDELMKVYFIIWEYFKFHKKIPQKKITEAYFEKVQLRHIKLLKYVEGEHNPAGIKQIYADDLQQLKSKALFTAVLYRFFNRPVLINMDAQKKGMILVGTKSFIECFETL
jgi:hypothetical protein